MDRTVPLAAVRLLDFVRATEVGTDGPSDYQVIYGFNQDKPPEPIEEAMNATSAKLRNLFRTANNFRSDDPLWSTLMATAEQPFGKKRAKELLAQPG